MELARVFAVLGLGLYAFVSRLLLFALLRKRLRGVAAWLPLAPPLLEIAYFRDRRELHSPWLGVLAVSSLVSLLLVLVVGPSVLLAMAEADTGAAR